MLTVKTKNDSVQVIDTKTGFIKQNIPISEKMANNAQIQGSDITVQTQDGRLKVYDAHTGFLKLNIP